MKYFTSLLLTCISVLVSAQSRLTKVAGTENLHATQLTVLNDMLVFSGLNTAPYYYPQYNLWYYNEIDTPVLTDIMLTKPDAYNPYPCNFLVADHALYFSILLYSKPFYLGAYPLVKWNGPGSSVLWEYFDTYHDARPMHLTALNDNIYVAINQGYTAWQLFECDVNNGACRQLTDINPNYAQGSQIKNIYAFNNRIYFAAAADAPANNYIVLMEYNPQTGKVTKLPTGDRMITNIGQYVTLDGKMYFTATVDTANAKTQLCMYDGINPVKVLTQFTNGHVNSVGGITAFRNQIYFRYEDYISQRIWTYNPATQKAEPAAQLRDIAVYDSSKIFTEYNGKLYFSANSTTGTDLLFNFDGYAPPVVIDSQVHNPAALAVFKNKLYFAAKTTANNDAIYSYYEPDSSDLFTGGETILYPNPSSASTALAFTLSQDRLLAFIVTDATGRTVYRKPMVNYRAGSNKIKFDISSFSNGLYICRLAAEDESPVWSGKLIKRE